MKLTLRKLDELEAAAVTAAVLPIGLCLDRFDLAHALVVEPIEGNPWTILLPASLVNGSGIDTSLLTRSAMDALVTYKDATGRAQALLLELCPDRKRGIATFELLRSSGGVVASGRISSRRGGKLAFKVAPPNTVAKRNRRSRVSGTLSADGALEFKFEPYPRGST